MKINQAASAGTLESSDILITLVPDEKGNSIDLTSSVEAYYGDSIRDTINAILDEYHIENAYVTAVDHGALDCTIQARCITAIRRAGEGNQS